MNKSIKNCIFKIISDNLGEEYEKLEKEYKKKGNIKVEHQDYIQFFLRIEDEFDIILDFLDKEKEAIYIDKLIDDVIKALGEKYVF